jgi:hypothetical protein
MIIQRVGESVAVIATDSPKLTKSGTQSARCSKIDDAFVFHDPKDLSKLDIKKNTPQPNPKMRR